MEPPPDVPNAGGAEEQVHSVELPLLPAASGNDEHCEQPKLKPQSTLDGFSAEMNTIMLFLMIVRNFCSVLLSV